MNELSAFYFHVAITCYWPTYWYLAKAMSSCTRSWLVKGVKQMENTCFRSSANTQLCYKRKSGLQHELTDWSNDALFREHM